MLRACDRCGVHPNVGQNRRLAILIDGGLSVERVLCLRCLETVLAAVTDACRKQAALLSPLSDPSLRYRMHELTRYSRSHNSPTTDYMILDSDDCYRLVASYPSRPHASRVWRERECRRLLDELNASVTA